MDKIIYLLKNNRLIQGAILLGGTTAAYYLFSNIISAVEAETIENDLDGIIMEVLNNVKIVELQGYKLYDLESASQIQDLLVELAIPQFQDFALQNREERRKVISTNQEKYFELVLQYNDRILGLIGEQQDKLKGYPLYSEECMSIAISMYMQDTKYMQKIIQAVSKLKASLPSTQKLSRLDAQNIISFFIVYLRSQPGILVHLIKYLVSKGHASGIIYPALKTLLFDHLSQEQGIEEEDYLVPVMEEGFQDDESIKKVQQQYSKLINEFMDYHQQ